MDKKFWDFKNVTADSADIYLYNEIGDSWWMETTSAKGFRKELDEIGNVKNLNIYINSLGGSVFDGMAIYSQLKRHKAYKNVYVDGIAASIASVIALAGDKITIPKNGYFMIHEPWMITMGPADDLRKAADTLDTLEDGILNVYEERTKKSRDELKQMMADETWMTGAEAVEHGFADETSEEVQIAASISKSDIWNKFKNPPEIQAKGGDLMVTGNEYRAKAKSAVKDMMAHLQSALGMAKSIDDEMPENINNSETRTEKGSEGMPINDEVRNNLDVNTQNYLAEIEEKANKYDALMLESKKDETVDMWASVPPDIKVQFDAMKAEASAAKEIANQEREARIQKEYEDKAREYGAVGSVGDVAKMLRNAYDVSEENGQKLEETFRAACERISLTEEIGNSLSEGVTDSDAKLDAMANAKAKTDGISYEKAYALILKSPEGKALQQDIFKERKVS